MCGQVNGEPMKKELAYLSKDPLQIFEYWNQIPDGVYTEWDGGGWFKKIGNRKDLLITGEIFQQQFLKLVHQLDQQSLF